MAIQSGKSMPHGQAVTPESWNEIERLAAQCDVKTGRFMETLFLGLSEQQVIAALARGSKVVLERKAEYHNMKRKIIEAAAQLTPSQRKKLLGE